MPTTTRKSSQQEEAYGYARISDDVRDEAGVNRQQDDIRAYCQRHGLRLVHIFVDNDIGASRHSRKFRPEYAKAVDGLERGEARHLVAYVIDRVWRQPKQLERMIDLADQKRIIVHTLTGEIDLGTPSGRYFARSLVNAAAMEADMTQQRVKRAMTQRKTDGKAPSNRAFGWRRAGEPDPDEAKLVRAVFTRFNKGESMHMLAEWLNDQGLATPRGGNNGWTTTQIKSMLGTPRHAGLVRMEDGELVPGSFKGIVDKRTWNRAQVLIVRRNERPTAPRTTSILGGLLHCGECGHIMHRTYTVKTERGPFYVYKCSASKFHRHKSKCPGNSISATVEPFIIDALLDTSDEPRFGKATARAQRQGNARLNKVLGEIAELEDRRDLVTAAITDQSRNAGSLIKAMGVLDDELARKRKEAHRLDTGSDERMVATVTKPGELRRRWGQLDTKDQRDALATILRLRGVRVEIDKAVAGNGPSVNTVRVRFVPTQ